VPEAGSARDERTTRPDHPTAAAAWRGTRCGDYVIIEPLGRGAMGEVFRALHPQLDRHVALKLVALPTGDAERRIAALRVLREGRALARLRHPNVVTVHDVGEADGHAYVAMELVDGATLRGWAATPRPMTEVLAKLAQAGRGLAAVHRAGLVHRDVKPDNVLVSLHGEVRVGDFGLARLSDAGGDERGAAYAPLGNDATLSRSGAAVGTLPYMAPEVLAGAPATAASDQFSFCVTAFECLYGQLPFEGETPEALRASIEAGQVRRVASAIRLRAAMHRALLRGLAAAPADRHADLETLLASLTPVWRRRLRWLAAVAAVAAVAGAAGFALNRSAARTAQRCDDTASWSGTWDDAQRARVQLAFARTGLPYAAHAFEQVRTLLDRYTATWSSHQHQRCLVASVSAAREPQYELACLRQRRAEVALLVGKLAQADAEVVSTAARLSIALRPPTRCQLEPDGVARPALADAGGAMSAQLHTSLAAAGLAHDAGDLATAERLVRQILATATELDAPLASEARLMLGTVMRELGREGEDESMLFRAAVDADAAGLYGLAAEGWLGLAAATRQRPKADPTRWLALAGVALEKAGSPPDLAAAWISQRAFQLINDGDFPGALALQEQATRLLTAQYGPEDLRVAASRWRLATSLAMVKRFADAEPLLREVVAVRTRVLSPTHPDTLDAEQTLGICLQRSGRAREALPLLERQVTLREAVLGPSSPALAGPLGNLAGALTDLHREPEALVLLQRAVALREAAYGSSDPRLAKPLMNLGTVLVAMGRQAAAIPVLRRARDLFESSRGTGQLNGGYARIELADALAQLGRNDEALAELALVDSLPPDQYALLAQSASLARGTALLGLGRLSAAQRAFEQAAELSAREPTPPEVQRRVTEGLARARAGGGRAAAAQRAGNY